MLYKCPERFAHIKQEKFHRKTVEEHIVDAEKMAREHNGVLSSRKWLMENGHGGLVGAIQKCPKLFAHIVRERIPKLTKTVEEHVADAEELAKEHDGVLPRWGWLQEHGHSGLVNTIHKYPKLFARIYQIKPKKTVEEHIAEAEKLTREYDGVIPSQKWLIENGHGDLVGAIHKYPEMFAHIKRDKFCKHVEEHIADAERLAKEHSGVLPNQAWLKGNGYSGLSSAIYKYPERFTHIKQEKLRKTVEEYVVDAENLARDHDGVLPCLVWMIKNSHSGLSCVMRKHPEMFVHIKQQQKRPYKTAKGHVSDADNLAGEHDCNFGVEWKLPAVQRTVDEWVKIAEELAEKHDGVLSHQKWLRENGYSGLESSIDRHPEMFAHVEQKRLKGKTVETHIVEADRLVKEHGGVLPSRAWLRENNYSGLRHAIDRYPERFAHIKRMVRNKVL